MLQTTCVHVTHVSVVHSPVLVLAMHFLVHFCICCSIPTPCRRELQGWA